MTIIIMKKVLLVALVPVIAIALFLFSQSNSVLVSKGDFPMERLAGLPSCSGSELFSVSPIAPSDYTRIVPLGNMNPPNSHVFPADHMYMIIRTTGGSKESAAFEVPVYSPGNVRLARIDKIDVYKPVPYSDYSLYLAPCSEFVLEYHHVTTVSKEISEKLANPEWCIQSGDQRYCIYYMDLSLSAGQLIGTAGGDRKMGQEMDLDANDYRTSVKYANSERYSENQLHKVCPLEYFSETVKNELYGRIDRSVEPKCGEFEQDMQGTLQGNWMRKGRNNNNDEKNELSLVKDNSNPGMPSISFGSEALSPIEGDLITYSKQDSGYTNPDFANVTNDGRIYCFEQLKSRYTNGPVSFSFLAQVTGETSMKIGIVNSGSCGDGPWSMPGNAIEFER